jgi:hypothetical protein
MTADQVIAWFERKPGEAGVQKVVPDQPALAKAYRRAVRQQRVQEAIDAAIASFEEEDDDAIPIPPDLEARIREKLKGTAKSWD